MRKEGSKNLMHRMHPLHKYVTFRTISCALPPSLDALQKRVCIVLFFFSAVVNVIMSDLVLREDISDFTLL